MDGSESSSVSGQRAGQPSVDFAALQRELQLETIYDLIVALHSHRTEQELVEDVLQRVCAAVDPAAAAIVTRDPYGSPRAAAWVGWEESQPSAEALLAESVWQELVLSGASLARADAFLAGRPYRELLASPLAYRGVFLGFIAVLDKERRGDSTDSSFGHGDRRFLDSVAALAGVTLDSLRHMEQLVSRSERLEEENRVLREQLVADLAGQRIVAHSPALRHVLNIAERVAPRSINVLVRGESGTGKELIAKMLHARSGRPGPLVAVNCAALPESLLESELFGIEGGVATGVEARVGKFELADAGTLFLDEIGDLEVSLQVKLLRVLQEREVVRVGGNEAIKVDVRVVTATHRALEELTQRGEFREDLFYRLKGVELEIPPLRERREDIPHLVRYFVESFCQREGIPIPQIDQEALTLLLAHDYPGNVRELQNLIEGAVSLAEDAIGAELIGSMLSGGDSEEAQALELAAIERRHIRRVLRITGGNKSAAARLLGVDRRTLSRKGY